MAYYLVKASYTPEGIKGVLEKGGSARADAVRSAIEGMGGTMHSFHFAFGDDDAYVLAEAPDNIAVAALGLAVSASGLASTSVVVLLTPEEIDEAARRQITYTPPGK